MALLLSISCLPSLLGTEQIPTPHYINMNSMHKFTSERVNFNEFTVYIYNIGFEQSDWSFTRDLNHVGTERRDTTFRIPALRGGILHAVSRC